MFLELTVQTIAASYLVGMLWAFLSWTRTIHETYARSKTAEDRRNRNLARTLEQSSRDTFAEGYLCLLWPVLVLRNLRSVASVARSWWSRRANVSQR